MTDVPVLGILLLLVVVSAPWWVKRVRAVQPDAAVRVVGRTAITRNTVVAVVRVGERRLLVGAGEHGVTVLSELDAAADEATGNEDLAGPADLRCPPDLSELLELDLQDRTDAAPALTTGDVPSPIATTTGPRIGPLDRLRLMTVRTAPQGRPIRVPSRR